MKQFLEPVKILAFQSLKKKCCVAEQEDHMDHGKEWYTAIIFSAKKLFYHLSQSK